MPQRRTRIPGRLAGAAIAALLLAGCGSSHNASSGGSSGSGGAAKPASSAKSVGAAKSAGATSAASKPEAGQPSAAESNGCAAVSEPHPREESLPKPKMTLKKGEKVTVAVETNCGAFDIALATAEAPTIANSFAYLVEEGFYNDVTFHRIVPEFVIQGGDPTGTGEGGPGYEVVEAPPADLKYTIGTVAMAKTETAPAGAAGSQFYIVSGPEGETLPPEYALVGRVTKGLEVVERIGKLAGPEERPSEPVVIEKMTLERG